MQPALVCCPPERGFFSPLAGGHAQWKRVTAHCPPGELRGAAVSLHQGPRKVPAVAREPPTAQGPPTVVHGQTAGAGDWREDLHEGGMTGLVARHATPGSQAKASGAAMAGGAGSRDWQMPCLEPPLPERRSSRRAAKRWGSPEMPMLLPAISKVGPAEEEAAAVSRQLLLDRFQGSVEVDSIEGVDFFSFSSAEDLREFACSMDQLIEEQYREPRSPEGSAPSARSGAADDEWRESDWVEEQQSVVVLPRKTTDITKIKGWRRKAFTSDQVADHMAADEAADQTTRWVMDQMNEHAWRHQEQQKKPPLVARSSVAGERMAQPPQAPVVSLSKSVRGAFLSSSLDEFLEHRSELRVGQLAQLNPNIVPPPQGQGVLALSAPPVATPPTPAQVGPTREMTSSHVPRRYGRAAESPIASRFARSEKPDGPSGRRRPSTVANQAPEEEPAAPVASSPKPTPKRVKVEAKEDAPFLAMTSRRLRGSGQVTPSEAATAPIPSKDVPKKEPDSKPSSAASQKKVAPKEAPPPYGASAGSGDYPLVTETVLSGKQRELLRALLASTQCSRPLTVALPAEPCFVCPQLDQGDALAAASALGLPGDKCPAKSEKATPPPSSSMVHRAGGNSTKATSGPSVVEVAKQVPPVATREPATKGSPADTAAKTPRKPRAWSLPGGASPTEAHQSTRSRRPIRLPARFQDSALYFSPNGDLFDVVPPVSPRQRGRIQPTASSPKVAAPRPPMPVQPAAATAAADPPSTTTSSWSGSSSSSSASSSRSSSPCDSCCVPAKTPQGKKQAPLVNGGQTLKQLSRLKTDGFVSLHKLESRWPPSTSTEGSVDVDVESISDSDSGSRWTRPYPGKEKLDDKACRERLRRHEMIKLFMQLQNVAFRTPRARPLSKVSILGQANQYLRGLITLSAHLVEEKRWLLRRQVALQGCLEAARLGPVQLPKMEPRPPPVPSYVAEVCDLSLPTVPPLREPVEEPATPRLPTPPPLPHRRRRRGLVATTTHGEPAGTHARGGCRPSRPAGPVFKSAAPTGGLPVGGSRRHGTSGKEKHSAKSGAEQPQVGAKDAAPRAPDEPTPVTFKLDEGRIGALRSVPTPTDVPRKYTLYPVKGTVLGDLSKVAAAAQHIIGPCVIKRVKLRSGQTVFVYRQPAADGSLSEEGPPEEEKAAHQQQAGPAEPLPDQACEGAQGGQPGSPAGPHLQDDRDLGETSEWVSGDGDTCIVMKLPVSSDEDSCSSSES